MRRRGLTPLPAGMPQAADDRDLRGRTVRGALASTLAQVANIALRTGSIVLLSRLLLPRDFGLVAMATSVTGILSLFRDFGLSTASVQRADVTRDQVSTLFWVNLVAGVALTALCAGLAPLLVQFYGEPRLLGVTIALSTAFVLNGATVQHRALLQRQMRFAALAIIDTVALAVAIATSIAMALTGFGYWAVVSMSITPLAVGLTGVWVAARWIPGRPRRHAGIAPLLQYGGTLTVNSLVVYFAYNADKILLGRFWGADALGLYSRAYQLISLPTDSLNSAISQVALPALARVQNDPQRLRRYFLQGYGVFLTLMIPLAVACALFADDIVHVFLGARWAESAGVFRLLTPTMLVFALINPMAWMLLAIGRTKTSLGMALIIAPAAIAGYSIGLPAGPEGVAIGFSAAMLAIAAPAVLWAKKRTTLTVGDLVGGIVPPLVSAALAAGVAIGFARVTGDVQPVLLRLVLETAVFAGAFVISLLIVQKDKSVYWKMWRDANLRTADT